MIVHIHNGKCQKLITEYHTGDYLMKINKNNFSIDLFHQTKLINHPDNVNKQNIIKSSNYYVNISGDYYIEGCICWHRPA